MPAAARSLETLREVGLGYLRLGQPATELSGGEAQRIKLATELQRARRGHALYLLDEPTTGLHPADVALLLRQLHGWSTRATPSCWSSTTSTRSPTADWVIDLGPAAGTRAAGSSPPAPPPTVAAADGSATAPLPGASDGGSQTGVWCTERVTELSDVDQVDLLDDQTDEVEVEARGHRPPRAPGATSPT